MTDQKSLITSAVDPDVGQSMVLYSRMQPMKDALGCKDLTDTELQLFAMVCYHSGLDPFLKQIYAIKRGGRVTHQTGIDGYRSTAENTHEYAGSDQAVFEECDCGSEDSPKQHPSVARVTIHRILPNGHVVDQIGVARFHELKPSHTRKSADQDWNDAMWWRMPYNQLSKCAEANGLRKAFPRVLNGVYITEEMQQADVVDGEAVEIASKPSAKERVKARRARAETKPEAKTEESFEDLATLAHATADQGHPANAESPEADEDDEPQDQHDESAQAPVWGQESTVVPDCPNGHGPMAKSKYRGHYCRTCRATSE